jgi:hypothetical protein
MGQCVTGTASMSPREIVMDGEALGRHDVGAARGNQHKEIGS